MLNILREEIECRVDNKGHPLKPSKQSKSTPIVQNVDDDHDGFNAEFLKHDRSMPRDSFIRKNESNARMMMNKTQSF